MADLFTSTLLLINSTSVNGFKVIDSSTSAEFFVAFPFFVSVMFFLSFAATWHLLARCKLSGYEKLLLGVFSIFALPSIFCLERGNFLILCLPLLMLSLTARRQIPYCDCIRLSYFNKNIFRSPASHANCKPRRKRDFCLFVCCRYFELLCDFLPGLEFQC